MRLTFEVPDEEVARVIRDAVLMVQSLLGDRVVADRPVTMDEAVRVSGLGKSMFKRYAADGRIPRVRRGPRSFDYYERPIIAARAAGFPRNAPTGEGTPTPPRSRTRPGVRRPMVERDS